MKRDNSPTIENNKRMTREGVGRKAGEKAVALLLGVGITAGIGGCGNEKTPQDNALETSISEVTQDNGNYNDGNYDSNPTDILNDRSSIRVEVHPYPETSIKAREITNRYGAIENFPSPVDIHGVHPVLNKAFTLQNVGQRTVETLGFSKDRVSFDEYLAYVPQIEQFANRSDVVSVNGKEYNAGKMIKDPEYLNELVLKNRDATTRAEILMALSTYDHGVINQYAKAEYTRDTSLGPDQINKEYKKLDEYATDQEILDNYDIELAVLSTIEDISMRRELLFMHTRPLVHSIEINPRFTKVLNTKNLDPVIEHHAAENHTSEHMSPNTVRPNNTSSMVHLRDISTYNLRDSSASYPELMGFAYYDFGDIQKWINIAEIAHYKIDR